MDSEDDIQPLIHYDGSRELQWELTLQHITTDPEFEQVVYGYHKRRWRTTLTYILSTLLCGIPFLVFHWYPTWFLYATSVRCPFQIADCVLVEEIYQKKCKEYYIHKILHKNIADASGLLNQGFIDDGDNNKEHVETFDVVNTPITFDDGTKINVQNYRYFRHKKQSLIWDGSRAQWFRLGGIECGATCAQLHTSATTPPSSERRVRMLNFYGLNEITVPVQSIMTLVLLEVFNPFYVFQFFTIGVWIAENYFYYCIAVVLMSVFGVATSVIQTKKNQANLRATVEAHDTVELADGRRVDSRMVAPGDVIILPNRCTLQFDAALISGSAVLNESMLTGESVPVTKTSLLRVDRPYSLKEHASSTLFCGTRVIQCKSFNNEPVRALVLRTGYGTTKGQLVRSILYPVPADFKFDRDSYKFIIILAFIAVIGLIYTVVLKIYRARSLGDVTLKALDILTIVVPPALPAAMTVGRLYAVSRLKRARIACLNTRAVNVSGSLDCICFDKTGTLTEDGLDMWGVVPVSDSAPRLGTPQRNPRHLNEMHPLKLAMASCHSLTYLDGELAGDPLDLKMFESTGWVLDPNASETIDNEFVVHTIVRPRAASNMEVEAVPIQVGIVQQHQFVSSLQRASVVTRVLGEDVLRVYCKGAPEMLRTLCVPDTVPLDLFEVLNSYAEKGYRVIACATRTLRVNSTQLQSMHREEVERDLEFLGLVIMENRLKGATTGIIRELKDANIHVVMITGDNILTAISVAKECGILMSDERVVHLHADVTGDSPAIYCESTLHGATVGRRRPLHSSWRVDSGHDSWFSSALSSNGRHVDVEAASTEPKYKIVMNGETWKVLRDHYPDMLPRVVAKGAVFARMTSDQKQQLIIEYQALGYYVGMCGDGANDCGALRAAHTGISLSELESSVAAPFTSANPDIVCVARVLREGRAALATSFGVFKFMVAYSLTEFLSVAFLYYFDSNLTDFQFLYIDVALIVNFAFFFGMTEAYTGKLCRNPPLTSLLGLIPLLSLAGQMALIAVGQYLSYYALTLFPWYVRHTYEGDEANECWENYAVFAISMFQYIILTIVFSHGSPYRKSVITNKQLMISILIMTAVCIYIAVAPTEWIATILQLRMPKDALLSYIILGLAGINFILALFFERVIIEYVMEYKRYIPTCLKEKHIRKTPHLTIKRQLTDMDYLDCDTAIRYDNGTDSAIDTSGPDR